MAYEDVPKNINLYVPPWLHDTKITFAIFNLSLAGFTIIFQLKNPKSLRNMGRFFLIILALQTFGQVNLLIQELFFQDLSGPYYEIRNFIRPRSPFTRLCVYFGTIKIFVDLLSQLYTLWLAVLIKQILKDPIHRLNRYIYFYHALTIMVSLAVTGLIAILNNFGVEETLQCGIMHQPGLDDEIIMGVPYLLVPIELYLIVKIMKQTPFIVKQSLKRFVAKYLFFLFFFMLKQILQVTLIIFGSSVPYFYQYEAEDGFKHIRYAYIIWEQILFFCLAVSTICERTFFSWCVIQYRRFFKKKRVRPQTSSRRDAPVNTSQRLQGMAGVFQSMDFENGLMAMPMMSANNSMAQGADSSDEDFEGGNNQIEMRDDIDIEDEQRFQNLVQDEEEVTRDTMNLAQKTSYFIINAVLMSIVHCIQSGRKTTDQNVVGVMTGLVKFAQKVLTYQLKDNDINHIMDMAEFFNKFEHLCASNVTSKSSKQLYLLIDGKKVQIKITEYGPDMLKNIRRDSGYNEEYLINSFAPAANKIAMSQFQEGSGKSASFFFYTENKQFVIKTLKDSELELLARRGILEKYYNHVHKHPKSLLSRFYGVFTVKIKYMKPINVIIMDNLRGNFDDHFQRMYDLKGSTFQRINSAPSSQFSCRKDLNFIDDIDKRVIVSQDVQKYLCDQIHKDKEFLKSCELMDYSLLIIFYKKEIADEQDAAANSRENSFGFQPEKKTSSLALPSDMNFGERSSAGNQLFSIHEAADESSSINAPLLMPGSHSYVPQGHKLTIAPDNMIEMHNPLLAQNQPQVPGRSQNSINFSELTPENNRHSGKARAIDKFGKILRAQTLIKNIGKKLDPRQLQQALHVNQPQIRDEDLKPRIDEFIHFRCNQDRTIYYRLGIIDFLTHYNKKKQIETGWLKLRNRNVDPTTFSCVEPKLYGDRFHKFMKDNLFGSGSIPRISVLDKQ